MKRALIAGGTRFAKLADECVGAFALLNPIGRLGQVDVGHRSSRIDGEIIQVTDICSKMERKHIIHSPLLETNRLWRKCHEF